MKFVRRAETRWLRAIESGWGTVAEESARAAAASLDLTEDGALHTLAARLAAQGCHLDDVMAWVELLAQSRRSVRRMLRHDGAQSLAAGWTEGMLAAELGAGRIAEFDLLRVRARQQSDHASSVGRGAVDRGYLIVVEMHGPATHIDVAAALLRRIFVHGETVAHTPSGRLLVLTRRGSEQFRNTEIVSHQLQATPALRGASFRVWLEPLSTAVEHLDAHLLSLAS